MCILSQDLLTAAEDCFKSLPASEHKTLAQRWVGPGDEFMNSDLISDLVLLTKYNAMVHRAQLLKRAQVLHVSIVLYSEGKVVCTLVHTLATSPYGWFLNFPHMCA